MDNNLAVQDASQGMPTAQVPVNARVTAEIGRAHV